MIVDIIQNPVHNKEILDFFKKNNEPNLLNYLDLVAIGTVCDVVRLTKFNRSIVSKGLEIIKLRKSKSISTILDKAKLKFKSSKPI